MATDETLIRLAEAHRRAADIARAEALLRADAAWQQTYSETFSKVYYETLVELLAERRKDAAA
jgi:hypothetical protein